MLIPSFPEEILWGGHQVGVRVIRPVARHRRQDGLLDVHCELYDPRVISPAEALPSIPLVVRGVSDSMISDHRYFSWTLYPQLRKLADDFDRHGYAFRC